MGNYKELAIEVIYQALRDLLRPWASQDSSKRAAAQKNLESAKEFCLVPDNEDLSFWCTLAGWSPSMITAFAKKIVAGEVSWEQLTGVFDRTPSPVTESEEDLC